MKMSLSMRGFENNYDGLCSLTVTRLVTWIRSSVSIEVFNYFLRYHLLILIF